MSKAALSIASRITAVIGNEPITADTIARAAAVVAGEENAKRMAARTINRRTQLATAAA